MEVNSENNETLIFLEFSGGLDSLILNQERELELKIYSNEVNLGQLIAYIRKYIIGSKKDYFSFIPELNNNKLNSNTNKLEDNNSKNLNVLDNKVKVECNIELFNGLLNFNETCQIRPGVLVLVNDVDWELLEKEKTLLKNNHRVTFISTLHGG